MQASYVNAGASSATSEIQSVLAPDERLLWSGKPPGGIRLETADLARIAFGLLFGAVFAYTAWSMSSSTRSGFLEPWSRWGIWGGALLVLSLLFWLYFVAGQYVIDAVRRSHSSYGVTDRRVIILTNWPGRGTKSFDFRTLSKVQVTLGRNGEGTIRFGEPPAWGFFLGRRGGVDLWGMSPKAPGFVSIPQVQEVYDLIYQAQASANGYPAPAPSPQ